MDRDKLTERLRRTFRAAGLAPEQADLVIEGRAGGLSAERRLALVTIDADAIQRTLLASPRPVTIFGASAALADWDRELRDMKAERVPETATVLFAGGGSAVLVVPEEGAAEVARSLEAGFLRAMEARATAARVSVSPAELAEGPRGASDGPDRSAFGLVQDGGGFAGCMSNLAFALRGAKLAARAHAYVTEPTDAPRCEETGDRPRAEGTRSRFAERHRQGGRDRKYKDSQARSFDELLKRAKARRLAFVCVDGAGIGKLLTGVRTLGQYAELSATLDGAFSGILDEAAREELGLARDAHQVVLAGGDDLLLVVPAEARDGRPDALTLTSRIVHRIEGVFAGTPWPVGVGAGVLITAGGLPAKTAFEYARALCDSAKGAIRGEARSGVDFEVVLAGAPLSASIASLREARERNAPDFPALGKTGSTLRDTQRPFPLARFDALLAAARALREGGVGQSPLATFTRAMQRDLNTALIDLHYQLARDTRGTLRRALGVESLEPTRPSDWIVSQVAGEPDVYATGLVDLAEVSKLERRR